MAEDLKREREPQIDSPDLLRLIGIDYFSPKLPVGWIKLYPQDFIVEEVALDGTVHTVDCAPLFAETFSTQEVIYEADLVKIGLSTLEARDHVASVLGVAQEHVRYAGIKDTIALTSQHITMRGVKDPLLFEKVSGGQLFLKNIQPIEQVSGIGESKGNRFTVVIRTKDAIDAQSFQESLQNIQEEGFWNFYSFQRFWNPRLIGHIVGKLLLQRKHEEAIRYILFRDFPRETPSVREMRKNMEASWGKWQEVQKQYEQFPSIFYVELKILRYLVKAPADFLGALRRIPDTVRLCIYGYSAYLFNKKLSDLLKEGEVPYTLPQITSSFVEGRALYEPYLREDNVICDWNSVRKDFPFFVPNTLEWPVFQKAQVHGVHVQDNTVVMAFTLPKGVYATTFLAHLFQLGSEVPTIPGISQEQIDAKEVLGMGSLQKTLDYFSPFLKKFIEEHQALIE